MPGGQLRLEARWGRNLRPSVQPPLRSPVGAGRAGPRAQSRAGEVGSAARAGAGLGRVPRPRARWGQRPGKKKLAPSGRMEGEDRAEAGRGRYGLRGGLGNRDQGGIERVGQ